MYNVILAITSGPASGWESAIVLAPLLLSIAMVARFLYYETRIPAAVAAVLALFSNIPNVCALIDTFFSPPQTWFFPNFAVLFGIALLLIFWLTINFVMFVTLWQSVYHWSAIATALRM